MQPAASDEYSSARRTLLILPALCARAGRRADTFVLTRKFLDGVLEYTRHWPGPVVAAMEGSADVQTNLDELEVTPRDVPFELHWINWNDHQSHAALFSRAAMVLASLVDKHIRVPRLAGEFQAPVVFNSEYSVQTRRQIVDAETRNGVLRLRRKLWTTNLERRYRRAVSDAAGVQCNGTPTFESYRHINRRSLLYFDSRVRLQDMPSPRVIEERVERLMSGGPLRLGFSGRWIAMKGVDHLPRVALALDRLGVRYTLNICGDGPMRSQLETAIQRFNLADRVHLRGVLDFRSELLPFVAGEIDLFVCCHRQGDPSCTYLETMACGTPIVGYDNESLHGLAVLSSAAWLTPLDDPNRLAQKIAELDRDRVRLRQASRAAQEFANLHTFERTMCARIDHLRQCAGAHNVAGAEVGTC